ncbi:MAG TPA: hypothetical protein VJR48_16175, partial [Ktedonobacterales bacterium]|nr:hypothetical protein [Ktedonobacterales bacterium]
MRTRPVRDVTVRLSDVQDFLEEPANLGADRAASGIEELYRAIKMHTRALIQRPGAYRVTIELPRDKITDGLQLDMRALIQRYCRVQTEQRRQDLRILRQQAIDSLWRSLIVLALCLVLGGLATWLSQSGGHGFLRALVTAIATFFALSAGWVALWFPAEYFLYDTWPFQQDIRVYQQIAAADVVISARREGATAQEP